ncbi:hypothetical protein T01_11587 [Trichinella spiralis]|uniref:Uncharacterized protein n=1 Tax=Trichinella spiralis TaxID=6334 RepID=A0A0V0YWK6_TRISP|nr:hypothetical protein T01_11587 [Trichinella spiralis]
MTENKSEQSSTETSDRMVKRGNTSNFRVTNGTNANVTR